MNMALPEPDSPQPGPDDPIPVDPQPLDPASVVWRPPVEAGVRDVRNNLSRYLDLVADGVEVIVTNHGKAVARIGPVTSVRKIDQLIAEGRARPARSKDRWIPNPQDLGVTVSDLVLEQRR